MAQNINHQYSEETTEIITKPLPQHNRRRNPESELEKRLQRAMNAGRIFSWEMNPETRKLEWSSNMEAVIGFPLHDNVDKTLEMIHPDDLKSTVKQINEAIETGSEYESEYRLVNPENNEVFWFHSNGAMTADFADGKPLFCGVTQNITERKQAEEALRESEEEYRTLFNSIDEGFYLVEVLFDKNGRFEDLHFLQANPAAVRMAKRDWTNLRLSEISTRFAPEWFEVFERIAHTGKSERQEFYAAPLKVWYDFFAFKVGDENDNRVAMLFKDTTERKQAEEALRHSEEHSRLLIEGATDFAILKVSPDGLIASWNTGAENVFGYAESEIINQPFDVLFTPEDREEGIPQKDLETALEKGCVEDERWHLRKDGSRFFASGVLNSLKEGAEGFVKIARDQTKRLEAEKAQLDKEILQRLAQAQEDERRRFSRDLHDELGQQLTTLTMKLEQIRILGKDDQELSAKIDETQSIVQSLDDGVDFLAWELRPSLLDDLGLFAAIDKYVKEWSQYSGIPADFVTSHQNGTRFAFETETNLYRILQEALNNTNKHAQAKKAEVILNLRGDSIVLIVEDDGDGFNAEDKKTRSKGLGLLGIKERATLLGGNIEIESAPKQGTSIYIRVPITNPGENRSKQ